MGIQVTYTCDVCAKTLAAAQPIIVNINSGSGVVQKVYHPECYVKSIRPTLDP